MAPQLKEKQNAKKRKTINKTTPKVSSGRPQNLSNIPISSIARAYRPLQKRMDIRSRAHRAIWNHEQGFEILTDFELNILKPLTLFDSNNANHIHNVWKHFCTKHGLLTDIPVIHANTPYAKSKRAIAKHNYWLSRRATILDLVSYAAEQHPDWHWIFSTLTIDPAKYDTFWQHRSWRTWNATIVRLAIPNSKTRGSLGTRGDNDGTSHYIAVREPHNARRADHLHYLWATKFLPRTFTTPKAPPRHNHNQKDRPQIKLHSFWPWGLSFHEPIRFGLNDTWAKAGWSWPENLQTSGPLNVARYVTKYLLKGDSLWRLRKSHNWPSPQTTKTPTSLRRQLSNARGDPRSPNTPRLTSLLKKSIYETLKNLPANTAPPLQWLEITDNRYNQWMQSKTCQLKFRTESFGNFHSPEYAYKPEGTLQKVLSKLDQPFRPVERQTKLGGLNTNANLL